MFRLISTAALAFSAATAWNIGGHSPVKDLSTDQIQNAALFAVTTGKETFTKKYEQAAINDLKDFELNCGVHPVDFIASYILRHKNSNQ